MLNASATRIDGAISVYNRCRTASGFDDATGKATVVEGAGPGPGLPLGAFTHAAVAPCPALLDAALASATG